MQTPFWRFVRFTVGLGWGVWVSGPQASAQTPAQLSIQTYAGLTITGAVGTVYSVEYVTDLAQSNSPAAWRCLEFLQLPANPYLWADKSIPATGKRFYRAVVFSAPTNMVFIPPGTFRMGDPTNAVEATLFVPQTAVTISHGFWMGKTEVTQGEYLAVMSNNPSFFSTNNGYGEDLRLPVERVGWVDATNYCSALTQRDRAMGRIATNSQYRLPTEAEWEYACRAWTSTRFSYGDDPGLTNLTSYGWFGGGGTRPVGLKLPNPWGLYDMHGNVWEWCQDWFGSYNGGIAVDPQGPATGSFPVVRGGAWDVAADGCRSAFRSFFFGPYGVNNVIGFRVVLAPGRP